MADNGCVTFRGRLTLFLVALVLAPLVAGGVAAHVLAQRQAVREANARLEADELRIQQAQGRHFDALVYGFTPGVARRAFRGSSSHLEHLRRTYGLGFLFVSSRGRVTAAAMGHPRYSNGYSVPPDDVLRADRDGGPVLYDVKTIRVAGRVDGFVVGGVYTDGAFLRSLEVPAMAVAGGRVVASAVAHAPASISHRMYSDLPDGRHVLCACSAGKPTGIAIVTRLDHVGLLPKLHATLLLLLGLGLLLAAGLAFELARVLSRPHERALGRLAETERLSATDELTGLANRRALESVLAEETKRATRYGRPLSLLMVDVDHFKAINDTHGHDAGDRVLAEVARRIEAGVRADLDTVARYGGEEFTVVLPETGRDGAIVVAEKIREVIGSTPLHEEIAATVSVGIASCPEDGADRDSILRAADFALYEAKRGGRDRVVSRV